MADYRKSFNFRNGVQVDNDNLVVNSNGLVGFGTTVPTEVLDVRGTAKVVGLVTATRIYTGNLNVSGVSTLGNLTISTSGIITAVSGIVTFYGDGSKLSNLPTSQWVDTDVGLGFTSIYAPGNVGVSTNDPRYRFQVGGNPNSQSGVGINSTGDIKATGIITAATFSGSGSGLTGVPNSATTATSDNTASTIVARDSSGNFVAGTITANLTGTATTASSLTSAADISINSITANDSNPTRVNAGIVTASTRIRTAQIGIGTDSANAQLHVVKSGISSIQLTSYGDNESTITLGRGTSPSTDNGQIRFGHGNSGGSYTYSTDESLDIINYDTGNLNFYLNPSGLGTAFNWLTTASNRAMVLTQSGNLGINSTVPTEKLDVDGNVVASGSITGNTIVKDGGASSEFLKADGSVDTNTYLTTSGNGSALSGIVTSVSAGSNISVSGSTGSVTITGTQEFIGIVTASDFSGNGSTLSGIVTTANAGSNISLSGSTGTVTITGTQDFTGIVTASQGFISSSGISTGVEITFSGTTLTFTVSGIGSTSLTLA